MNDPLGGHYRPEDATEFLIRYTLVHAWTGFLDRLKIVFIGEQRGMQGPLSATPGATAMDRAAVRVENTMAFHGFHLGDITTYPPISFPHFALTQGKGMNHAPAVIFIKRDGCFTLTTITTTLTFKYLFHLIHFYSAAPPLPSIGKLQ